MSHQERVHADAGGGALQRRHEAVPHVAPQLRVQPALLLRIALQQVQHLQALRSTGATDDSDEMRRGTGADHENDSCRLQGEAWSYKCKGWQAAQGAAIRSKAALAALSSLALSGCDRPVSSAIGIPSDQRAIWSAGRCLDPHSERLQSCQRAAASVQT